MRRPSSGVDLLDAVLLQHLDLVRGDRAAAADDHADVLAALLLEHVDHVLEVLVVAALVGADCDAVGILLDGRAHDVGHAAVVAEVDTSAPLDCSRRRIMLMAASWPSNSDAADTKRSTPRPAGAGCCRGGSLLSHGLVVHCHWGDGRPSDIRRV